MREIGGWQFNVRFRWWMLGRRDIIFARNESEAWAIVRSRGWRGVKGFAPVKPVRLLV